MKHHGAIRAGLLAVVLGVGLAGCGIDKYNWHFGLGTSADDGVTTDTSVDRLTDGVLPAEPSTPEKPKKDAGKEPKPADGKQAKTETKTGEKPKSP